MEKYGSTGQVTDDNTIQCVRFACRVNKATGTLRNYNIHSFSTPTKVSERASIIRYTYIGCLVYVCRNIQYYGVRLDFSFSTSYFAKDQDRTLQHKLSKFLRACKICLGL